MKQTWRWFGPDDQVTIDDMLQAGVQGVVTGLYDLAPGTVWSSDAIAERKAEIAVMKDGAASHLEWDVVESLPVSEAIKTGQGPVTAHTRAYISSMENLAAQGIRTICYNFMPVLDWTRTDTSMRRPHGGTCMNFDLVDFAAFDLFILGRAESDQDYSVDIYDQAQIRHRNMSQHAKASLSSTICAGLPGSTAQLTVDGLHEALRLYESISAEALRKNLKQFLQTVIPVAERLGVKMACHPDDPPWPVLGLPRIVSTEQDLEWLVGCVDSPANGLTFCSGSLGARADNNLNAIAARFSEKIHFVHLRNVRRLSDATPTSFFEDTHLGGSTDMISLIKTLLTTHSDPSELPIRPDHGQDILSDLGTNTAPGYPLCGRMRGLAELRGAILALSASA